MELQSQNNLLKYEQSWKSHASWIFNVSHSYIS